MLPTPTPMHRKKKSSRRHDERSSRRARLSMKLNVPSPPTSFHSASPSCRDSRPRPFQLFVDGSVCLRLTKSLVGDYAAVAQRDAAVCARRKLVVVRDEQECRAAPAVHLDHQVEDVSAVARVEIAGRLVCEEYRRLVRKGARDRDALPLAAR